jgi:Tfp pilus assembly protein PilV
MSVSERRTIELRLPNWHLTRRHVISLLVLTCCLLSLVGVVYTVHLTSNRNQLQEATIYRTEMATELGAINKSAHQWSNINDQTFVAGPTQLRNLPPTYTGWVSLGKLELNKDGVVVLPSTLVLSPTLPAGVRSLLVSRLSNTVLYTVFRFMPCKIGAVPLVPAPKSANGYTAELETYNLRSSGCHYQ